MPPRARATGNAGTSVSKAIIDETGAPVEDAPQEWGSAVLNGRRIVFNQPNPAQLIVLRRLNRQLDTAKNGSQKFLLVAKMLDATSALMVSDADREWADLEVLEGRANLDTVTPLLIVAIGGNETLAAYEAREEQPKPRRVRRARS